MYSRSTEPRLFSLLASPYAKSTGGTRMIDLVTDNLDAIRNACEDHDVNTLWVFGSVVNGEWKQGHSDVDVIAGFGPHDVTLFRQHMGLIVQLEDILGVRVDVVDVESIEKRHFRAEVEGTRVLLYERSRQTVSA
jgi:predicted nucleotidyltransferase